MTTGSPLFKGNGAKIPKGRRNFTYMHLPDLPESPYLLALLFLQYTSLYQEKKNVKAF